MPSHPVHNYCAAILEQRSAANLILTVGVVRSLTVFGSPGGIRIHTTMILSHLTLPIGLRGHITQDTGCDPVLPPPAYCWICTVNNSMQGF